MLRRPKLQSGLLLAIFIGEWPAIRGMHNHDIEKLHRKMTKLASSAGNATNRHNAQVFANANLTGSASNESIQLAADQIDGDSVAEVVSGLAAAGAAVRAANEVCGEAGMIETALTGGDYYVYCMAVAVSVQAIGALGFFGYAWQFSPVFNGGTTSPPYTLPPFRTERNVQEETEFDVNLMDADTCESQTKNDMSVLKHYPDLLSENNATRNQTANTINVEMNTHLKIDLQCVVHDAQEVTEHGAQLGITDKNNIELYNEYEEKYNAMYNDWLAKDKAWQGCHFLCGDEPAKPKSKQEGPRRMVPENFIRLSQTMKTELQDFEKDVLFVTECSGKIVDGGCEPFRLNHELEKLQKEFKTVHVDWIGFRTTLCEYHKWTACPPSSSELLAALANVAQQHDWKPDTIELGAGAEPVPAGYSGVAPLGLCLAVMMYVVGKSMWKKRETPGGLKPLLQAVEA